MVNLSADLPNILTDSILRCTKKISKLIDSSSANTDQGQIPFSRLVQAVFPDCIKVLLTSRRHAILGGANHDSTPGQLRELAVQHQTRLRHRTLRPCSKSYPSTLPQNDGDGRIRPDRLASNLQRTSSHWAEYHKPSSCPELLHCPLDGSTCIAWAKHEGKKALKELRDISA